MSGEQPHLRIYKWDELQHYKNREPPWIKLYNRLLDHYEYGRLPDASKGQYTGLLMLASRHQNRIPLDVDWIAGRINATEPVDLRPLVSAGLIELYHADSIPLAQDDSTTLDLAGGDAPSQEGETEAEGEGTEGSSLRSSPSGDDADVENTIEMRNELAAALREDALLGASGEAAEVKMASNMDIAEALHEEGYAYSALTCAVRGARMMIQSRAAPFTDWIGPDETFGMGIFRHASEEGMKLVARCESYWQKMSPASEEARMAS